MNKVIVYFSYSNNTKQLVKKISEELSIETYRVERVIPYSKVYDTCAYIEAKEEWEKCIYPDIKNIDVDFSKYEKILLFFPIWWYTFPMPVGKFLKQLKGYKGEIIFFENSYTNDLNYVYNSLKDAKKIDNNLNIKQGLFNKSIKEHINFIKGE
ncbi:MAG: flavodoxin [Bacilli bacterium]